MEGMVVNLDFWIGRRVFLTGHTGFKGSWLSLWLQSLGAQVTGFALAPPTRPNLFEQAAVASGMTDLRGDIRDYQILRAALQENRPEVVIHMAAQPLVKQSYENPIETYSTNVMGTVNLLEAARAVPSVRAIVNVTTDKCYENQEWVWGYREHEPLGGYDPYSNSKACSELVTASYRSSFFTPEHWDRHQLGLASARAGNVVGGGDWAVNRLIPDILRSYEVGTALSIRNPEAIRPWQHVLEPLRGYLMLAEKLISDGPHFSQAWNFGPLDDDETPTLMRRTP
jgi:CDP-glucose 4,6-dehydratase